MIYFGKPKDPVTNRLSAFHHVTIGAGAGGDTGIEPMSGMYRAQVLADSSFMLQTLIQKTAQEMVSTYSNASTIADSNTGAWYALSIFGLCLNFGYPAICVNDGNEMLVAQSMSASGDTLSVTYTMRNIIGNNQPPSDSSALPEWIAALPALTISIDININSFSRSINFTDTNEYYKSLGFDTFKSNIQSALQDLFDNIWMGVSYDGNNTVQRFYNELTS